MAVEKFTPDLDPSAFLKVGSTGLTNWQAVNEIIANSIDSWISTGPKKNLSIEIDLHNNPANLEEGKLIITDNASGMTIDELKDSFGFFISKKHDDKNSEKYLGVFGFGFKAATSKIGTKITVITSTSDKNYHTIFVDYEKIKLQGKDFQLEIETKKHTSASKKLFNNYSVGTRVIIENFNSSFPAEVLDEYLPISWKKFLGSNNSFGKKVSISRLWVKANKNITPNETQANSDTITPINIPLTIKKGKDKYDIEVSGFVGLRTNSKDLNMPTQGIHLYRRGQLVEAYTHELYMDGAKHNSRNSLVGELDIGLDASVTKSKFDKDSEEYKQMRTAVKKVLAPFAEEARIMSIAAQKDQKIIDKAVANYRNKNNLKLTAKQQKLIAQGGSIEDEPNKGKKENDLLDGENNKEISSLVSLKMNNWNSFTYEDKKYNIIFEKIPEKDKQDGNLYKIMPPQGNDIYVVYYQEHPQGKYLEKALSKQEKDEVSALLVRVITSECIESFLRAEQHTASEIKECLIKVLNYKLIKGS
tara:strand:+ start:225 stop:1814 length:1590 start_codon:yes stop_codon:yes gene_type:complete